MTSFSYTEVSQAVLRQLSPILKNSGAQVVSADEMGEKINEQLEEKVKDDGKPQNSNNLNFQAFGSKSTLTFIVHNQFNRNTGNERGQSRCR